MTPLLRVRADSLRSYSSTPSWLPLLRRRPSKTVNQISKKSKQVARWIQNSDFIENCLIEMRYFIKKIFTVCTSSRCQMCSHIIEPKCLCNNQEVRFQLAKEDVVKSFKNSSSLIRSSQFNSKNFLTENWRNRFWKMFKAITYFVLVRFKNFSDISHVRGFVRKIREL